MAQSVGIGKLLIVQRDGTLFHLNTHTARGGSGSYSSAGVTNNKVGLGCAVLFGESDDTGAYV